MLQPGNRKISEDFVNWVNWPKQGALCSKHELKTGTIRLVTTRNVDVSDCNQGVTYMAQLTNKGKTGQHYMLQEAVMANTTYKIIDNFNDTILSISQLSNSSNYYLHWHHDENLETGSIKIDIAQAGVSYKLP